MKISEIQRKAKKQIAEMEEDEYVSKYRELLELEKQSKKQLKRSQNAIKKFEKDPDSFIEDNEDLW